jgi:hypothetical protein
MTAAPQAIHACQRSRGNVSPRLSGGGEGITDRPFCAPKCLVSGPYEASSGSPTASASVAPAR